MPGRSTDFKARLTEKEAELDRLRADGTAVCLAVEEYPRRSGHIMYVFEGLKSPDTPGFRIPVHYFEFRAFNPETMRLKDENYFQYYESPQPLKTAVKKHRLDQETRYRFYLSYDSLLHCLQLNGLTDDAIEARIEAHYTFLGRFLHPTHDAARDLHEQANSYDGQTRTGLRQAYEETAVLLGYLYVCYLLASILDETVAFFERAPAKYMADPGTTGLRAATARVPAEFPYFWFLTNDPPLWDRYTHCLHHEAQADVAGWGGYERVPFDRVLFNQHVYPHLKRAHGFWSNNA